MEKKMTLNDLVRKEARKNIGAYNFIKNPEEKARKRTHNLACKALVKFADEHDFPMGVLVYIGVGTSAHKPSVFDKGYKGFNEKKALAVLKLCEIFARRWGAEYRNNALLVHACSRYYELNKGKVSLFKQRVKEMEEGFNTKMYKGLRIDTAKKLAKVIFGDTAEYTKGGYIAMVGASK